MKSASARLEREPFADAREPFRPVLREAEVPSGVRLSLSSRPPSAIRRPNALAIELLSKWLAQPPDPEDERSWAELEARLPHLRVRFHEPE